MIVLGFDTATPSTAVALALAEGTTRQVRDDPRPGDHPGHATRLLAMVDRLLLSSRVEWPQLDRIAVGVGPGRFTGLRVGIATARGLAQSLSIPLVGVSSLRALAEAAAAQGDAGGGILAVIDARRDEAFAAAYAVAEGAVTCELGLPGALAPGALRTLPERARQGLELADDGHRSGLLAVGDGAVRFRAQLEAGGARVAPDDSPLHLIDPAAICRLGADAEPSHSPEGVIPDYRRAPDANTARARVLVGGITR